MEHKALRSHSTISRCSCMQSSDLTKFRIGHCSGLKAWIPRQPCARVGQTLHWTEGTTSSSLEPIKKNKKLGTETGSLVPTKTHPTPKFRVGFLLDNGHATGFSGTLPIPNHRGLVAAFPPSLSHSPLLTLSRVFFSFLFLSLTQYARILIPRGRPDKYSILCKHLHFHLSTVG